MKFLMVSLMSLMLSVQANTAQQATVAGQVRLADGRPVAGAQVTLFDLAALHRGAVAWAMTDESGYFALPLTSLGGSALPQGFALGPNYPNPFNPSTMIPYQLPTATHVRLDVFNVLGQHVATLVDAEQQAGFHAAKWDATNAAGRAMAAGVYLYRLTTGGEQQTQRMVLIDGQAGIAAGASSTAATMSTDAAVREYSLVVSGEGLTTYTDAAFEVRAGMAAVELVVDAAPLTMASGKRASGNSDNFPSWSPNGQQIAFASDRDGNFEIYVMDADGSNLRRLTNNGDRDVYPSWSPDGQQIAFVSDRDGNFEIYVMDADGSNPENRTNNPDSDGAPSWSPDGQQIAFMSNRDGNSEIYVIGWGVFSRLTHDPTDAPAWDRFPSWSPDGQQIAFVSDREGRRGIYVMDSDGDNLRRLTDHPASDGAPSWSPDGERIAFEDSDSEIYVMDSDGDNLRRLTINGDRDVYPSWSPDGQQIAFASDREGDSFEIYVMDADGSETSVSQAPEPETPEPETPEPETPEPETPEPETPEPETPEPEPETPEPEPETPTDPVAGGSTGEVQTFSLPGGALMEFVWIEPGVFWMGSPDTEAGRYDDEGPLHEVEISRGFWLGKFEVTQGQWEAVTGDTTTSYYQGDARRPVDSVSWDDVQRFIGRLNDAAGDSLYRLPTEAEWEYACRAGSSTRWFFGDDEGNLTKYAWYRDNNSPEGTKPVGEKEPNAWGLHDMHGNVWEWVQDWYDDDYYDNSPRVDPEGPTSGSVRVRRGGHFDLLPMSVRSAYRHLYSPDKRSSKIGVRLLRMPGN